MPARLARSRRAAALAGLAVVALVPGWRDSPSPPEPLRVTVSGGAIATAVPAGPGRVLTVAHVLDGARTVHVGARPARVLRIDRRLDLAELAVPGLVAPSLRLGGHGGATVRVLRDGRAVTLSTRVRRRATASIGDVRDRPVLELATAVRPGDSGAPVLDRHGRLLGLVFARGSRGAWAVRLD
ncbi:S1 family peptidase [Solirubrobacter deserti]|uniref:Trypsin-like peptidase domain-containing protein n=1 Tax=Solirubrobacter deserti TaxID=2282478 RepID=A0ABT4RKD1_9ACTN|nr:serine protease [Solirubrobacter deserti]MDA0138801.1 trypsin-like peptidase domain-containing protein [Solirubrobacter deserti]